MSSQKSMRIPAEFIQDENTPNSELRRSTRTRTPSKKQEDIQRLLAPKITPKMRKMNQENLSDDQSDSGANEVDEMNDRKKWSESLLRDKNELAGSQVIGFHTPKKKNGMIRLAENTPKTPATPITPSTKMQALSLNRTPGLAAIKRQQLVSTPSSARIKNKQVLEKRTKKVVDETESESSADEHSDFEPGDEDDSGDDDDDDDEVESEVEDDSSDDDSDAANQTHTNKRKVSIKSIATDQLATRSSTRARAKATSQIDDFIPDSDNYFMTASNKKSKTSDHTLDRLKASRLQHEDLFRLLSSINMSEEHQIRLAEMVQYHKTNYNRWMLEMSKGYNIIVYGSGSKQDLLFDFCKTHLTDKPLVFVNGFFPSITITDILRAIKKDLLDIDTNSRNDHEAVDLIASTLNAIPNGHVFLVLNNIDGTTLRKTKDQHIISRLAKIPNFHLITSIDHINALLMWDQTCMNNFNFIWYDCTTMLPYKNETAFENSVLFQNSGELNLAAMSNVFQSLTKNARGIYMILVKSQIANHKDSNYQGMTFKDLYQKCRENFLVSSDSTLRTQLIEFVDHNMAKIKRSHDGTELVSIPINTQILSIFAQQQNE